MDASRFDTLTRSLSTGGSRRRVLGLLAGALGLLYSGEAEDVAAHDALKKCNKLEGAKKKQCVKKAKKHNAQHAAGSATPPPTPGCTPNCFDRVCGPDGCGGSCGACPRVGQICNRGACECPADKPLVCGSACVAPCTGVTVLNPDTCACCIRSGESCGTSCGNCCSGLTTGQACIGRSSGSACTIDEQCSSRNCVSGRCEDCHANGDYCFYGSTRGAGVDTCGPSLTGQCLKTVDDETRCGVRNRNVVCNGCSNDIDCLVELGQGSGAFCVRDTGAQCDCPDGQTFCAVPR